jgi:hypothetical protein
MPTVKRTPAVADLQAMLGLPDPDGKRVSHAPALIVSVDIEKYGFQSVEHPATEIGIAVLDTRDVQNLPVGASNLDILKRIRCYHFRPKESGFLRNGKDWGGVDFDRANNFGFGKSEWITRAQIKAAVQKLLCIPDPTRPGEQIPVHVITQGGDGDLTGVGGFGMPKFDFLNLLSGAKKHELQVLAPDALPDLPKVGLASILIELGLCLDGQHNAGNDAMAQLVCTLLIAIDEHRQSTCIGPQPKNDTAPSELLQALAHHAQSINFPTVVGSHILCLRCGAIGHEQRACQAHVGTCKRCLGYNRHRTEFCFFGNGAYLEKKRQENYDRTKQHNDRLGRATAPFVPYA